MQNLISITLNILVLLIFTQNLLAQEMCADLFSSIKTELSQQTSEAVIINRLDALVKSSIDIQLNNFENPAQLQQTKESFEKQLTEIIKINQKYLDVFKMMLAQKAAELIETTNHKTRNERKEKKEKEEIVKEALDPVNLAKKLILHEILPGTFNMLGAEAPVTITKAYELAQTQTTQLQWSVIQVLLGISDPNKINPSNFKTGPESQVIKINGIDVEMNPDHPVEKVSYDDVAEWIAGLNKLSKEGNDQIQKEIQRVIPGHKKGHVYDLPTEAQWAFVMQNRGKNSEIHFDKSHDGELDQYAWYKKNANEQTHAVASKKARKIDRGDGTMIEFYDLEGNVWEWTKDALDGNSKLSGGIDPVGTTGPNRAMRGGSWGYDSSILRAGHRYPDLASFSSDDFGFRLSRTGP